MYCFHFDIEIDEDWAKYEYELPNGEKVSGNLAIKGRIDLVTQREDGIIEVVAFDENENKNFEIFLFDDDLDGNADRAEIDEDDNGTADIMAYDKDQDGEWDKYEKIS